MSCRLDYLFKLFPQRLNLADCRQHFVTIIRKGQRWQESNGRIRVIERCQVWQYFQNLKQKIVFISDQEQSDLFSLNFFSILFLKVNRQLQSMYPEDTFNSIQLLFRPFLLKEAWYLITPASPEIFGNKMLQISLFTLLFFPCYVSHHQCDRSSKEKALCQADAQQWPATAKVSAPHGFKRVKMSCIDCSTLKSFTSISFLTTLQLCLIWEESVGSTGQWNGCLLPKYPRFSTLLSSSRKTVVWVNVVLSMLICSFDCW